jgi:hypothetical protein
MIYETPITVRVINSAGDDQTGVADIAYVGIDPYAVQLIFPVLTASGLIDDVVWLISRDLVAEALESSGVKGNGDVEILREGDKTVFFLTSHEGTASVAVASADVIDFLDVTYKIIPRGEENIEDDLDDFIADLLMVGE